MGRNKLSKFNENNSFDFLFQPSYSDLTEGVFPLKGKWSSFFNNSNPIVIEVGCGKGEYTVELAKRDPNRNYIGIDVKGARLWHGAKCIRDLELKNAAFVRSRIEFLSMVFSSGEVSEIWLTFPDPQMNYAKRRLFSSRYLNIYKEFLINNGIINLKTDSPFLFNYAKRLVIENRIKSKIIIEGITEEDRNTNNLDIITYYEKQWIDRGLSINFLSVILSAGQDIKEVYDKDLEKDYHRSFGRIIRNG